jgi:hypothetical protein
MKGRTLALGQFPFQHQMALLKRVASEATGAKSPSSGTIVAMEAKKAYEHDSVLAAVCENEKGKDTKIVLCHDLERQAEGIGASETKDKLGFVRSGWPTLIAGHPRTCLCRAEKNRPLRLAARKGGRIKR